jgi:hypothetical protein
VENSRRGQIGEGIEKNTDNKYLRVLLYPWENLVFGVPSAL